MKTKVIVAIIAIMAMFAQQSVAQDKKASKYEVIKIKTSSKCGMCKDAIEKAMAYTKGVKSSDLDLKSQIITVTYNPKKTTAKKIRTAISKSGYDADDVKAEEKAYKKLPACCKKDAKAH